MKCFYSKEFSVKAFTDVENAFIQDYMPLSDGNAVKVYLYGLFLCKNPQFASDVKDVAKTLSLSPENVVEYFKFYEEFGLVSVISTDPLQVEYMPVKSALSTKPRKYKPEKYGEFNKCVQLLISSRMIMTNEYSAYFDVMEDYGIKPEAMLMIVKYCVEKSGTSVNKNYILKIAKDFGNRGITTVDKIERELSSYLSKSAELEKILRAMSIKRIPDVTDLNLFKKWTEELNFEPENILYAASKVKKGGMEKLDSFILELYSNKSFSKEEIKHFSDNKEKTYQLALKINKALSIYVEVLDTVIDTYTNKWLSFGFTDQTLLLIASYCFRNSKNSLQDMDALVEELRNRGYIDLTSVSDYFENIKKTDEFISKMLKVAGVNRRPTPWDRDNVAVWKSWNFTEEMILESAKISAGKSSAIAYMNGVLSNWKNSGIFTISDLEKTPETTTTLSTLEAYNREYEKRRNKAVQLAQKNTENAMEIQGFSSLYERMFSIEKDLAFAEIASDENTLKTLETEKENLLVKINEMLSTIGLKLDDLSPKYKCSKCNDTGYVGNNKCDCL
ncbi:MAG: DnaD domain protein [Clostridia bacterium]|nr:DnaD domain protein [Clostridia bacterium]